LEKLRIESAAAASQEAIRNEALEESKRQIEQRLSEMEKLTVQIEDNAAAASSTWQSEQQQLQERIAFLERALETANAARTEKLDDYRELELKLQEAIDSKALLQSDLERAVSELNSRTPSNEKPDRDDSPAWDVSGAVESEILRVQLHLDDIEKALADPAIELGSEMRLSRERGELQIYLKGLRYALHDVAAPSSAVEDTCPA